MTTKIETFKKLQQKKDLPNIQPGDTVRIFQKILGQKDQEKIQTFEGQILARKHGKDISATITVRKVISGIGVEKIFPIHSPLIEKIEILKRVKARRAKLYYLRRAKGKRAKLKKKDFIKETLEKKPEVTDNKEKKTTIEEK